MFLDFVRGFKCANCGKKCDQGVTVEGMDMFGKVWEKSAVGYDCAQELFGFKKATIKMMVSANLEKEKMVAIGFTQKDFAAGLRKMLEGK